MIVNKDRVRLLVQALDSNEFQQGAGSLRLAQADGTVKHCCLGVATVVALRNGLQVGTDEAWGRNSILTPAVQAWYGFDAEHPTLVQPDGNCDGAAALNDSGHGFRYIAECFRLTFLDEDTP